MEFNFKDSGEYLLSFQFLGIPPKGERTMVRNDQNLTGIKSFQFLGIPPKGELDAEG